DAGRDPERGQGPRVPRGHHARGRARAGGRRPQRRHREGRRSRLLDHGRRVRRCRRAHRRHGGRRLGGGRPRPEGQGADRVGVPAPAPGPGPVHLPAPRRLPGVHGRPAERRDDRRGVRDGAAARPLAAAARPHVRGGRADGAAGGGALPRASGRWARRAARGSVRRLRRQGRRPGRRGVRAERRGHRPRHAGRGAPAGQERRPAARGRPDLPGPHADRHVQHLRGRAGRPGRRPGHRCGPRAGRQGPHPGERRAGRGHEARCGARRHLRRPGRLLRVDASHDPLGPGLRGQRLPVLLRRQHARGRAEHLDVRPDQRDAAVRRGDRQPRPQGGGHRLPGARPWRQHGGRQAGPRAGRRGPRPARDPLGRGAGL
ncbi:MAG: Alanine dehydrogenase, partial [uncultured Frankineae bacterium]